MSALNRALRNLTEDAPETVTWDRLIDVEPRLEALRREVASDDDRSWDAYKNYKGEMCALVGRHAEDDGLPDWMLTPIAYDSAHDVILRPYW